VNRVIAVIIIAAFIYAAGYSAGKQSIRDKFNGLMDRKGRK
jgi:hypothetical protein